MSQRDHSVPKPEAQAALLTCEQDLASSISPETRGVFPPVLASARMIALMELAAARCLEPLLASGERSVGVALSIEHTKPTPLGAHVVAHARWLGQEGKLHRFEVIAEDEAGEIGRGAHTRAIVETDRLLAGAAKRARSRPKHVQPG